MVLRALPILLLGALVAAHAQDAALGSAMTTPGAVGAMATLGGGLDDTTKGVADTLHYSARTLDYDDASRIFLLSGTARLEYRRTVLIADSIWYDLGAGLLEAAGKPQLQDPTVAPFLGLRMRYNLKDRSGQVLKGSSDDNGQHYRGEEVRRLADKRLQVMDADYCECKGDFEPDYYFASQAMELEPNASAVAAPVVLNVESVPVAVLPLAYFPLGKGRRSGLLTPKFGGDQLQGFFIRNAGFYWAVSDYADAQASGDLVEGKAGRFDQASLAATTRYKKRYWLDGNLTWTEHLSQFGENGSQWDMKYEHSQELLPQPGKSTIKGSGSFVSNRSVRQDNALTTAEVLDQTANANLQWQYVWPNSSFLLLANQQQNLNSGLMSRQLPTATFNTRGELFSWLDLDESNPLSDWSYTYSGKVSRYEDHKADNDTATGRPDALRWLGATQTASLSATHKLGYLRLSPQISGSHFWSGNSYTVADDTLYTHRWRPWDDNRFDPGNVFLWNTGASLATDIYGIWMPQWGSFTGLRHTLTPSVGYTYYPKVDTNHSFVTHPLLGQSVGQAKAQLLSLTLDQKLDLKLLDGSAPDTGKSKAGKSKPYSLLSVRSSTNYDFEKTVRPWADITSSVGTGLLTGLDLSTSFTHSLYDFWGGDSVTEVAPILKSWRVTLRKSWAFTGSFSDGISVNADSLEHKPWTLATDLSSEIVGTRVTRDAFQTTRTQSGGFSLTINPTRAWSASYTARYNFDEGEFVSHDLKFRRQIGCWDLDFGWVPAGPASGWTFQVRIRDLPDVKIQANSTSIRKSRSTTTQ